MGSLFNLASRLATAVIVLAILFLIGRFLQHHYFTCLLASVAAPAVVLIIGGIALALRSE